MFCSFAVILLDCDKLLDYCCFGCWFWAFATCCGLVWVIVFASLIVCIIFVCWIVVLVSG